MLSVLDGAVLVISAVEGVQPQTRVLMRALQRLRIPVLLFVNKIDRPGADTGRVLRAIARAADARRSSRWVGTRALGTRAAGFTPGPSAADAAAAARLTEVLAEHDERHPGRLRRGRGWRSRTAAAPRASRLRRRRAPGASGLLRLRDHRSGHRAADGRPRRAAACRRGRCRRARSPARSSRSSAAPAARRSPTSGCSRARCAPATGCSLGHGRDGKVTAIGVIGRDSADGRHAAVDPSRRRPLLRRPGRDRLRREIARLRGLTAIQVGDQIGPPSASLASAASGRPSSRPARQRPARQRPACPAAGPRSTSSARPRWNRSSRPARPGDRGTLRAALGQLAEQDPLINVRQDDAVGELSVSLYGEVQSGGHRRPRWPATSAST